MKLFKKIKQIFGRVYYNSQMNSIINGDKNQLDDFNSSLDNFPIDEHEQHEIYNIALTAKKAIEIKDPDKLIFEIINNCNKDLRKQYKITQNKVKIAANGIIDKYNEYNQSE